ncbi:MAG: hypothetical protein HRU76_12150 [Phycisphaeraceae bacterium]|nr:hypothetical protein [Phycisphaerales bacterium]QOJ18291.1 MAG: hypothetical protein HRU76_12150 [Phycisphaeraceae bacterium]
MKRVRFLNIVLTALVVVLAGHLWVRVAERPLLATSAAAQDDAGGTLGIPNAAKQRQEIIDALKRLTAELEKTNKQLKEAKFKVEVTNLPEPAKSGS